MADESGEKRCVASGPDYPWLPVEIVSLTCEEFADHADRAPEDAGVQRARWFRVPRPAVDAGGRTGACRSKEPGPCGYVRRGPSAPSPGRSRPPARLPRTTIAFHRDGRPARNNQARPARRHEPDRREHTECPIGAAGLGPLDVHGAPEPRRRPRTMSRPRSASRVKKVGELTRHGGLTDEIAHVDGVPTQHARLIPGLCPGRRLERQRDFINQSTRSRRPGPI